MPVATATPTQFRTGAWKKTEPPYGAFLFRSAARPPYGVGARLDERRQLLFQLRGVDETGLIAGIDAALPLSNAAQAADKVLISDDLSAMSRLGMTSG